MTTKFKNLNPGDFFEHMGAVFVKCWESENDFSNAILITPQQLGPAPARIQIFTEDAEVNKGYMISSNFMPSIEV